MLLWFFDRVIWASFVTISMFFSTHHKKGYLSQRQIVHCNIVQAVCGGAMASALSKARWKQVSIFMCIRMIDLFCCEPWVGFYFSDSSTSMGLHVCFGYRRVVFAFISMFVYFGFASTCRLIRFLGFFRFLFSFSLLTASQF